MSKAAFWSVTRNKHRVVSHGRQALRDAVNQRGVIALRQIGAANRAGEQHIAHKCALDLG